MKITLVSVVGGPCEVLAQMLAHYRALGIDECVLHVQAQSRDDPTLDRIFRIANASGASIASVRLGPWVSGINPMLYTSSRLLAADEWFVLADQDEFHVYPDDLRTLLGYCDRHSFDYLEGAFVDRVSEDGSLPNVCDTTSLWDQFPFGTMLTGHVLGGVINKVVAAKGRVRIPGGQHAALSGRGCPVETAYTPVHHFKWTGSILPELKRRSRLEGVLTAEEQNTYVRECKRFLRFYENHGRIDLSDRLLMSGKCDPVYPHWDSICTWRSSAAMFSPELNYRPRRRAGLMRYWPSVKRRGA